VTRSDVSEQAVRLGLHLFERLLPQRILRVRALDARVGLFVLLLVGLHAVVAAGGRGLQCADAAHRGDVEDQGDREGDGSQGASTGGEQRADDDGDDHQLQGQHRHAVERVGGADRQRDEQDQSEQDADDERYPAECVRRLLLLRRALGCGRRARHGRGARMLHDGAGLTARIAIAAGRRHGWRTLGAGDVARPLLLVIHHHGLSVPEPPPSSPCC